MHCTILTLVGLLTGLAIAAPTYSTADASRTSTHSASVGPCVTTDEDCADVMSGTACYAANQFHGDVLGCVDATSAEEAGRKVCKCWGCVGPRLGDWVHQNLTSCGLEVTGDA